MRTSPRTCKRSSPSAGHWIRQPGTDPRFQRHHRRRTKRQTAADVLSSIRAVVGPEDIALSTVGVMELEHGVWRAKDPAQASRRRKFFDDLFAAVAIHPLTFDIARHAARIDAESRQNGLVIPFQDLVIGVTALEFGYAVATANVRHFQMIPGLVVKRI